MTDKPDKPVLTLTTGAANRLAQLAATAGLLTNPDDLFRVGAFNEDHLSEIPPAPQRPIATATHADLVAWEKELKAWAMAAFPPIATTPKRLDSLKALVKSAAEKGLMGGSFADRHLLRAVGLAPSDE